MLFDIDHFKAYNDKHGHQAGDECLKKVAGKVAAAARRPLDFAGRYGGEEFIVLLSDTDNRIAKEIAEKIRRSVSVLGNEDMKVTISIGISSRVLSSYPEQELLALIKKADSNLYTAKRDGKNRSVFE